MTDAVDGAITEAIIIVGAGQAGLQSAESLRTGGFNGPVILVGDEPYGPYHRPPLSKAWLAGELTPSQLQIRSPETLAKKSITLETGVTVKSIDRAARKVMLSDGRELAYQGLVLATGATARVLPLPGAAASNVLPLRTRAEADAMALHFKRCAELSLPVVVIGGGFIGLEVASTARKKGLNAVVLEAAPRLLSRVLTPMLSDHYAQLHRDHGVELVLDAQIAALEVEQGLASAVLMKDGKRYPAGLVVMGVGVSANDALARDAGLECDRGIVVDECARTSDPYIVAAGDCTARRLPDGSLLRLESVNNATEQGKAAAAILLGQTRPFTSTPWFWSDQYDRKLQMAGLGTGADQHVPRGSVDGPFSVYHFKAGRLVSVDSVNAPKDHLQARKLLDAGALPTPEQAGDVSFDLGSLLMV
jgi:3-phenylpropionate/trans-cinnamate dioxygenase ferredoxin reductase component